MVATCGWTPKSLIRTIKATTGAKVEVVVEDVDTRSVVCVMETDDVVPPSGGGFSTQPHDKTTKTRRTKTGLMVRY